jgi:endoplasmic reticulum-Golgi intermediate compartment protein 3
MQDPTNPHAIYQPGEGCRVSGFMKVNKVAGNFHIAHGESIVRDGRHIHQFIPSEAPKFNISHTIHSISFGDPYPNMKPNPLDGGENSFISNRWLVFVT